MIGVLKVSIQEGNALKEQEMIKEMFILRRSKMKINKSHCFFEQSGTFKNEFIKLGIPAEDYDIQNEFGQTDHVIDLFD